MAGAHRWTAPAPWTVRLVPLRQASEDNSTAWRSESTHSRHPSTDSRDRAVSFKTWPFGCRTLHSGTAGNAPTGGRIRARRGGRSAAPAESRPGQVDRVVLWRHLL